MQTLTQLGFGQLRYGRNQRLGAERLSSPPWSYHPLPSSWFPGLLQPSPPWLLNGHGIPWHPGPSPSPLMGGGHKRDGTLSAMSSHWASARCKGTWFLSSVPARASVVNTEHSGVKEKSEFNSSEPMPHAQAWCLCQQTAHLHHSPRHSEAPWSGPLFLVQMVLEAVEFTLQSQVFLTSKLTMNADESHGTVMHHLPVEIYSEIPVVWFHHCVSPTHHTYTELDAYCIRRSYGTRHF
jgi:hypothetical protein